MSTLAGSCSVNEHGQGNAICLQEEIHLEWWSFQPAMLDNWVRNYWKSDSEDWKFWLWELVGLIFCFIPPICTTCVPGILFLFRGWYCWWFRNPANQSGKCSFCPRFSRLKIHMPGGYFRDFFHPTQVTGEDVSSAPRYSASIVSAPWWKTMDDDPQKK